MTWTVVILILGTLMLLGGIGLLLFADKKDSSTLMLWGMQGFVWGFFLITVASKSVPLYLSIGCLLLLESLLIQHHGYENSLKGPGKDILRRSCILISALCAAVTYVIIFTCHTPNEGSSYALMVIGGCTLLTLTAMPIEKLKLERRKSFLKIFILSSVFFAGVASIISITTLTLFRALASWTLLLESVFLFGYVINQTVSRSKLRAIKGLIALVVCIGLLATIIIKSPHDPLFNFIPSSKGETPIPLPPEL